MKTATRYEVWEAGPLGSLADGAARRLAEHDYPDVATALRTAEIFDAEEQEVARRELRAVKRKFVVVEASTTRVRVCS